MTPPRQARSPSPDQDGAEFEELPIRRIVAGRASRPGIGLFLGVVAVVALLASGLGLLGGRPSPSSTAAAADVPRTSLLPTLEIAPVPQVTPAAACGSPDESVPAVVLSVNDQVISSSSFVFTSLPGELPSPGIPDWLESSRIDIRSDVPVLLRTAQDACAVAWTIELAGQGGSIALETVRNPSLDPVVARQNHFPLLLSRYRGQDFNLDATLTFESVVVRTSWPIRILPFEAPNPRLTKGDAAIDMDVGCHTRLVLGNGATELTNPCYADVEAPDREPAILKPAARLAFRFEAGWQVVAAVVTCGQLSDGAFTPEEDPTCPTGPIEPAEVLRIIAPRTAGVRTLAIDACGVQKLEDAVNELCGTWYATIRIED